MHAAPVRLTASAAAVAAALLLGGAARPVPASPAGPAPVKISVGDFNSSFSAMKKLKPVTKAGRGVVGVLLPDTVSSNRYTKFDAPYLKRAFSTAGLPSSLLIVQNALGSDATQLAQAQADIVQGASVLILDPLDSGVGQRIEPFAKQHGVDVIDYDRLTLGGSRPYFVSFDQVAVGKAIGLGLVSCVSAWHVKAPKVIVMKGAPTDSKAALLAQGYDEVMATYFKSGKWTDVANPPGTWTPDVALSEFEQQYKAHPAINVALTPNDYISAAIIGYLQHKGIKPKSFPVTGQDATAARPAEHPHRLPVRHRLRARLPRSARGGGGRALPAGPADAARLAGERPLQGPAVKASVPSVLFKPVWVTAKNLKSTVIADKYVTVAQLCAKPYARACKAAGI